jgi:site-specific DNA-methyltransferase (adenine-specific)/modification methylase
MKPVVIGDATLYLSDCMHVLPILKPVDAVITDPPFGISFAAQPTKGQRKAGMVAVGWDDELAVDIDALRALGTVQIIWGGNYYSLPPSRGWLTWYKPDAPPSMGHFEMGWTNIDQNTRQLSCSISSTNPERVGHPTQKPLRVMAWSIEQAGAAAQTILDPFMGSGTTGVAAIQLGRKFIGIERDERYFEIAVKRIEQAVAQGQLFAPEPVKQVQESLL